MFEPDNPGRENTKAKAIGPWRGRGRLLSCLFKIYHLPKCLLVLLISASDIRVNHALMWGVSLTSLNISASLKPKPQFHLDSELLIRDIIPNAYCRELKCKRERYTSTRGFVC